MAVEQMIVPPQLVSMLVKNFDLVPSKRGYVAPTVYKQAGQTMTGWNVYKSFDDAWEKLRYVLGVPGARNINPSGSVTFSGSSAQTMGINVDFFVGLSATRWSPAHYLFVRSAMQEIKNFFFVYRMYKTDGTGPFYAIFDPRCFGVSATVVNDVKAENLAELDEFYRSVAILKNQHNNLVNFMNEQIKLPITPARQMTINQGQMAVSNLRAQIGQIQGLEVTYGTAGQIGFVALAPIVWWAIASIVAAWSVQKIVTEVQKTKRISASFDFNKWAQEHKLRIAQEVKAGNITEGDAKTLIQQTEKAAEAAAKVATDSSGSKDGFLETVKMLGIGLLVFKGLDLFKK